MYFSDSETQSPYDDPMLSQMEFNNTPGLAPECNSYKWKVQVIAATGEIEDKMLTTKDVWKLQNQRVIVHFDEEHGQPDEDSGGLLGSWLGQLSNDVNLLPIDYTDWRVYPPHRKDKAWDVIQSKFWFENAETRKKYVLSVLGSRCKDFKVRLWKMYKRNDKDETMLNRPTLIDDDQWKNFVTIRFTEKWKKRRDRNINNRRKHVIPHVCGRKSFARKRRDIRNKTGKTPCRAEFFIASRMKPDGSFVCAEAKNRADELNLLLSQNPSAGTSNNTIARLDDEYSKVFGPERSGRVRCVGRGPTPSKLLKYSTTPAVDATNAEVVHLRSQVTSLTTQMQNFAGFIQQLVGATSLQTSMSQPNMGALLSNMANQGNVAAVSNPQNSQGMENENSEHVAGGFVNLLEQPNLTSILSILANPLQSQGFLNGRIENATRDTSDGTYQGERVHSKY